MIHRYFKCLVLVIFGGFLFLAPATLMADDVRSEWIQISIASPSSVEVRGLLSIPENNFGNLPAVLLLGDCQQPKPFQKTWANLLASLGYVTLLLDPSSLPETENPCIAKAELLKAAHETLISLSGDFQVDHMSVITWGALPPPLPEKETGPFAAAIAFYPDCSRDPLTANQPPVLIFDPTTKSIQAQTPCRELATKANAAGREVHLRIYPGVHSGFDNPNAGVAHIPSPQQAAYDLAAHQDAIKRVEAFLNQHLQVTLAAPYPSKAFSPLPPQLDRDETPRITYGYGTWTHDPAHPGSNVPPIGRSVFDRVFSRLKGANADYTLPDTYEGIIERLEEYLEPDPRGLNPIKEVLIPHGRSLQREAARPNYYHQPRIVAAVDGQPKHRADGGSLFLKDRLFLGYQETAQVLEVISYNEAASRFEFQVVKNFGPGLKPEVVHADRRLCTSCHQNGAPLFPREDWRETNATDNTARELKKIMQRYKGVLVGRRGEIPAAIDISTDRANLLPVLQRLWREGCGFENDLASNQCRAAAFEAMLQYRLSNGNDFDRYSPLFKSRYTERMTPRWRTFWPGGLYISNSDIPDRDPTEDATIFGLRDPLTMRPPMEIWSGFKRSDLDRMIIALAEDLPSADIKKLDQWLAVPAKTTPTESEERDITCTLTRQLRRGLAFPISFACEAKDLQLTGAVSPLHLPQASGEITNLQIGPYESRDRQTLVQVATPQNNAKSFRIMLNGKHMRLPDGRRLARLRFLTEAPVIGAPVPVPARLTIVDDFEPVRQALGEMTLSVLSDKPFHGPRMMSQLFKALGASSTNWCCTAGRAAPAIKLDVAGSTADHLRNMKATEPARIFETYCATCHRTENTMPPNFLFGDRNTVAANIDRCASRMAYRLSMWEKSVDDRPKSPMPPENALALMGFNKTQWRNSPELATLRKYLKTRVMMEIHADTDYEDLPECLPGPDRGTGSH